MFIKVEIIFDQFAQVLLFSFSVFYSTDNEVASLTMAAAYYDGSGQKLFVEENFHIPFHMQSGASWGMFALKRSCRDNILSVNINIFMYIIFSVYTIMI